MRGNQFFVAILILLWQLPSVNAQVSKKAPEHFFNNPANLNPDPDYTPGDFPLADIYKAQTIFYTQRSELIAAADVASGDYLYTVGAGEVSFSVMKNETAPVLGYFRDYLGVVKMGPNGPEKMTMVIDINSLDTGVPGRNNRILNLFFESMKPDWGTARVEFDKFDLHGNTLETLEDGQLHRIEAYGTLTLNGKTQKMSAYLKVLKQGGTWAVETEEPVPLFISDFGFGQRIYELMKSCNHKSMGNEVRINAKLYFR
jgi:polyisoprenoid-binding protein YceI